MAIAWCWVKKRRKIFDTQRTAEFLIFTGQAGEQAQKDPKKLASAGLKSKVETIIEILKENPYQDPHAFEKFVGDLAGAYSSRINIQHPIFYKVLNEEKIVKVIRMWTHYE